MAFRLVMRRLPLVLTLFSLCCICFAYGLTTERYKIFPYSVLRDAQTALSALAEVYQTAPVDGSNSQRRASSYRDPDVVVRTKSHSPAAGDELLLVSGGAGYLTDHCETGCLAWLIDREGSVKHVWEYDPSLWHDLHRVSRVPLVSGELYPVGLHMFEDGGLLATFQGENTFPFAIGLARFDVNSNLLWKKECFAHHWLSIADDGRIFVPALRVVDSPVPIANTNANITSETGKIYSDVILVIDANGNVLDEINMLDAIFASGWAGLLNRPGTLGSGEVVAADPLHLNDVQRVGDRSASFQSWLSPDDLLVSFASINTIGILDPNTRHFKWMSAGTTVGQHSPRFYDRGVLVLDNLGGDQELGGTQLVKIDLERGQPTVLFPKRGVVTPDVCRTETSGHLDLSHDGDRVLMALANAAAVWEIDLQSGEVLWEYNYFHPFEPDQLQREAKIHTAKYINNAAFLHDRDES